MKSKKNNPTNASFLTTDAELKEEIVSTIAEANEQENLVGSPEQEEHRLDNKEHNVPQEASKQSNKEEEQKRLAEARIEKARTKVEFDRTNAALKAAKKNNASEEELKKLEEEFNIADLAYQKACRDLVELKMEIKFNNSRLKQKPELRENGTILSVRHLKMFFKLGSWPDYVKLKAVHDISFDIKEKETFGIVGESGCGKSTTGRCIIHLYNITSGSIYYKGYRIGAGDRWNRKEIKYSRIHANEAVNELKKELKAKLAATSDENEKQALTDECNQKIAEIRERNRKVVAEQRAKIKQIRHDNSHAPRKLLNEIQMIFQDPVDSLDPRMTVADIIQEGLHIQGHRNARDNHKKTVDILEKVGLVPEHASRYPHEFSGGQRQRIGIARALIMNPKILICDEPISALDVSIRAQIINLLNELKEEMQITMIFIAHDLSTVKYFCDRIAVMYYGNMVELATSDELFKHPLHPYTKSLLSAIPQPNPLSEKRRERITYNPMTTHDYSKQKPTFREILPGHFVLCNDEEFAKYQEEIKAIDSKK